MMFFLLGVQEKKIVGDTRKNFFFVEDTKEKKIVDDTRKNFFLLKIQKKKNLLMIQEKKIVPFSSPNEGGAERAKLVFFSCTNHTPQ